MLPAEQQLGLSFLSIVIPLRTFRGRAKTRVLARPLKVPRASKGLLLGNSNCDLFFTNPNKMRAFHSNENGWFCTYPLSVASLFWGKERGKQEALIWMKKFHLNRTLKTINESVNHVSKSQWHIHTVLLINQKLTYYIFDEINLD